MVSGNNNIIVYQFPIVLRLGYRTDWQLGLEDPPPPPRENRTGSPSFLPGEGGGCIQATSKLGKIYSSINSAPFNDPYY